MYSVYMALVYYFLQGLIPFFLENVGTRDKFRWLRILNDDFQKTIYFSTFPVDGRPIEPIFGHLASKGTFESKYSRLFAVKVSKSHKITCFQSGLC